MGCNPQLGNEVVAEVKAARPRPPRAAGGARARYRRRGHCRPSAKRRTDLRGRRYPYPTGQPKRSQSHDHAVGPVPLPGLQTVAGAPRETVVMCMPAVTQAHHTHEPMISRAVKAAIRHGSDNMRDAVDGVSDIENENERCPQRQEPGRTEEQPGAAKEQDDMRHGEREVRQGTADEAVPGIRRYIGRQVIVLLVASGTVPPIEENAQRPGQSVSNARQGVLSSEIPAVVGMPESVQRRVRIHRRVGVRVVETVIAGPLYGRAGRQAQGYQGNARVPSTTPATDVTAPGDNRDRSPARRRSSKNAQRATSGSADARPSPASNMAQLLELQEIQTRGHLRGLDHAVDQPIVKDPFGQRLLELRQVLLVVAAMIEQERHLVVRQLRVAP